MVYLARDFARVILVYLQAIAQYLHQFTRSGNSQDDKADFFGQESGLLNRESVLFLHFHDPVCRLRTQ